MKKELEALALLNQAVSQLQVNRETHTRLQQAVMTLQEALKPKKEKDAKQNT